MQCRGSSGFDSPYPSFIFLLNRDSITFVCEPQTGGPFLFFLCFHLLVCFFRRNILSRAPGVFYRSQIKLPLSLAWNPFHPTLPQNAVRATATTAPQRGCWVQNIKDRLYVQAYQRTLDVIEFGHQLVVLHSNGRRRAIEWFASPVMTGEGYRTTYVRAADLLFTGRHRGERTK
jgi:hypothetical protein